MRDWVKTQCMARARARARARERGLGSWGARGWRLGPGRGLVLKLGLVVREGLRRGSVLSVVVRLGGEKVEKVGPGAGLRRGLGVESYT